MKNKLKFKIALNQQKNGREYSGSLTALERKISLTFLINVNGFEQFKNFTPNNIGGLREKFKIQIQKKDSHSDIKLSDNEYMVFFQIIFPITWDFYHNEQTQDYNRGKIKELLIPDSHLSKKLNTSLLIGVESEISLEEEGAKILQQEKFN